MISKLISISLLKSNSCLNVCKLPLVSWNRKSNISLVAFKSNKIRLDNETATLLEKLSLVNFENKKHLEVVEDAINFAARIQSVDTDCTEPLISVLENENLKLRDDIIKEGNCREEILLNAALVEEGFFIAPPGNIPVNLDSARSVVSRLKYGPLGELLRQNIHQEWIYSTVINRDVNVYPFCSMNDETDLLAGIKNHYLEAIVMNGGHFPFSVTFSQMPLVQNINTSFDAEENKYFRVQNICAMKCFTFTTLEEGSRFFHYWLRQRKIWWRKFSANPTRFSLANINKIPQKMEFAHIQSEFPWGVELVEEVRLYSQDIFDKLSTEEQNAWSVKKGKSRIFPVIIESVTNLELASFTFLCDAFVEDIRLDTGLPHQVIRLHRKLAPYKVAIVVNFLENDEQKEDLLHLAEYLSLNLKKNFVPTLFLRETKSTEEWFQYYDMLSVPFVVVLESSTLNDGLFGLRSRETTLQERLHITKLSEYMTQLLKNY